MGEEFDKVEFDKIEKELLYNLHRIRAGITETIRTLREKGNAGQFIKSELCMAFICADTFSRIYKIYQGSTEDELDHEIGKRFKSWFACFVFTEKNSIYRDYSAEINCDVGFAWEIRNSLVHFYGLPDPQKNGFFTSFSTGVDAAYMRYIERRFKERGKTVKVLHADYLIKAILDGLLPQLEAMTEMIKENPREYVDRVLLAHKIVMEQGGVVVTKYKEEFSPLDSFPPTTQNSHFVFRVIADMRQQFTDRE